MTFEAIDPDRQLGYLIVRAGDLVSRVWLEGLREHGINPRQFSVLALIARAPGLSQAELARRALITPQSMSELLTRLLAAGLIARPAPAPGLAAQLELTDAGRDLLESAYPQVAALGLESVQALDATEQEQLAGLLRKLVAAHA